MNMVSSMREARHAQIIDVHVVTGFLSRAREVDFFKHMKRAGKEGRAAEDWAICRQSHVSLKVRDS